MQAASVSGAENSFSAYLQRRHQYYTPRRRAVAETFFSASGHVSVEELYLLVREKHSGIGQATVYRTLKLLEDANLASPVDYDGIVRYEATTVRPHHDHLFCTDCGREVEFTCGEIESLQERVCSSHGFTLRSHHVTLYGICPECAARSKKGRSAPAAG